MSSNVERIQNTFKNGFNEAKDIVSDAKDIAKDQSKNIKASSKDWIKYVTSHPLQSLLFGATIGLAFRGLLK